MNFFPTLRPAALLGALLIATATQAGVVQTYGSGSAVTTVNHSAGFEGNTSVAANYSEGGLDFTDSSNSGNGGCGYAYTNCVVDPTDPTDVFSLAFSGNYFAADGTNARLSIRSQGAEDLSAIEFAFSSGFLDMFGLWETFRDGVQTGTGRFNVLDSYTGTVIGLSDAAGFDEVRLAAFHNGTATTGLSAPAIDDVRAQTAQALPLPASWTLVAGALAALAFTRRRRET
jgi:hypothetical protein